MLKWFEQNMNRNVWKEQKMLTEDRKSKKTLSVTVQPNKKNLGKGDNIAFFFSPSNARNCLKKEETFDKLKFTLSNVSLLKSVEIICN